MGRGGDEGLLSGRFFLQHGSVDGSGSAERRGMWHHAPSVRFFSLLKRNGHIFFIINTPNSQLGFKRLCKKIHLKCSSRVNNQNNNV